MYGFLVSMILFFTCALARQSMAQWPAPPGRSGAIDEIVRLSERSWYIKDGVYGGHTFFSQNDTAHSTKLDVIPWFNASGGIGYDGMTNSAISRANAGIGLALKAHKHWSVFVGFTRVNEILPDYLERYTDSLNVLFGAGIRVREATNWRAANVPLATIAYKAGRYFTLEAGINKHFWGHGMRSLFLSDVAAPFPYMSATADIGKIKYTSLWAQMRDISYGQGFGNARIKYTSMHLLAWNVSPSVQLQLFEGVVWQDRDTLSRRSLDLAYANPVLFFRPVEFAQGSADNVILGAGVRWKWSHRSQIYGQIMLDEFLLSQVRAANGWWGNKFGAQLGFKSVNIANKKLLVQLETNVMRPFTYTHGSPVQAWGHLNQPLAHPLGANFAELMGLIRWEYRQWTCQLRGMAAIVGRDAPGLNFGGNIFASYRNPYQTFNNTIGQGVNSNVIWQEATIAYTMKNHWLEWYFSQVFRTSNAGEMRQNDLFVAIGCRARGLLDMVRDF